MTAEPTPEELLQHPPTPAEDAATPITFARVIGPGIAAIRRLWLPFVLLQLCGAAVVIGYFKVDAVRSACDAIAAVKQRGGFAFSAAAMAFCAGLLPEIFKFLTGVDRRLDRQRLADTLFVMCLYAVSGSLVDAFYRVLGATFGNSLNPLIIAAKVLIDEFIYTPIIGVSIIAIAYAWRRYHYSAARVLREINARWYLVTVAPLLLPAWAYWIPMTTLMYALPPSLTFVYGAIASAAIALLLITIVTEK